MRVRMRAGHDDVNPSSAGELDDLPDREDLAGEVGDVTDVDDLRLRCDGALHPLGEVVLGGWWDREADFFENDPVAPLPLVPRREHARVVLGRREHLVTTLQRDAE